MNKLQKRQKEQRYLAKQADKLRQKGVQDAIDILQVLPVYVLMTKYKFGNVRLERFITELWRLTLKVQQNKELLNTIVNDIEMTSGLKFNKNGDLVNLWNPEGKIKRCVRKPRKVA